MYKLEESKNLGRKIRRDDLKDIGVPSWTLLEDFIKAGKKEEALELINYMFNHEVKFMHDLYTDWTWGLLTYIADNFGEEHVPKAMNAVAMLNPLHSKSAPSDKENSTLELVQRMAEANRAHCARPGHVTVTEEPDRYILTLDPCGSGGRMRQTGRTEPPYNFGVTKKAYPWSWSRQGVSYYCAHCALWTGIGGIERQGFPVRVHEYPEKAGDPCRIIFYKDPERIPEKHFTELGKKKDISKYKR
ncbi:MAG: hypothetical protein HYX96_05725 [Chloroflexi bacterium]|nr:hypothetical protein [Chloroflexota bacterium]